ncbi:MAG: hypothetical protein N2491_07210 [Negativicutes bacterium]|nr:hypothetical protein [Negativicutes bacterium]
MRTISINFCGGCNPRIDCGRLAAEVRHALDKQGCKVLVNQADADFVVFLSGCTANCAWRYGDSDRPQAIVAGASLDSFALGENELAAEIINRVSDYFAKLENHLPG